jgi:hypothetical protein
MTILKPIELYNLIGYTVWHINDISVNVLKTVFEK